MQHIQKLHFLLVRLMAGDFQNGSLVDNKKLMAGLKEFQGILSNREELYVNPNYKPTPLEKDLKQAEERLSEIIYSQLKATDMTNATIDQLRELHEDYGKHCHHRKINDDGKVWQQQQKVRFQILTKAKKTESVKEKVSALNFIVTNSNWSEEEHKEANSLLEDLGESEEQVHIKTFGERPK